jgi:sulfate transport system ATP-binding protein/putative spermidine/putrescine transport system ATP-binding protein
MSKVVGINLKLSNFHLKMDDFEILDQGITMISGPSGSGKSTLFRILIGFQSCPGFHWFIDNLDLSKLSVKNRRLGVVLQGFDLFPHLTAQKNIELAGAARGLSPIEIKNKIEELSKKLSELEKITDKHNNQIAVIFEAIKKLITATIPKSSTSKSAHIGFRTEDKI